jgi:tetratricopeptide (TPR) repeat protein
MRASTAAGEQRVVRVFVSSTFRDMEAERDELVKRAFPQLRKLCESRGVTWSEVDLRWGITEEQSQRGEVLCICLAEIQRCRPYFIGLLGERYGWVPDRVPEELIEQEPWLGAHLDHSVTELEILHGVLNDPRMADRSLFYFRDRGYIDSLPLEQRADHLETTTAEEIERLGAKEAARRARERRDKLSALKDQIRATGLPVRENYADPRALGQYVLEDLTRIIDQLHPEGSEPDPLDREAMDHEAFARSRGEVYIGRQSYYDRLDEHARGDGEPLVLLGESGSGKSALLANWALNYRRDHPDEPLLVHFIGATPYSADWAAIVRRIMAEVNRRYGIRATIPDNPDELRGALANCLHMAAQRGRVVLILDALNQLEDRDGAPDLVWLPPVIPSNVRLIVSTLQGRALNDLERRRWPTMVVSALRPPERMKLLWRYLRLYTKRLNKPRRRRIVCAGQTANPLYLRALLDELRVFGVHERLDSRIDHYLTATTVDGLYEKILERYENDYERERPGLVRDAMSMLWAARRGLSESEVLEMLGADQRPLPRAHWSPLYLAADASLVSRSGLIGFGHEYLRRAVESRYLATPAGQAQARLRLAGYFEKQEISARRIDEGPWQLAEAKAWPRLFDLLADRAFFTAAWRASRHDVAAYWVRVEASSEMRMVDAYRPALRNPVADSGFSRSVEALLANAGHLQEALSMTGPLIEHFRAQKAWESLEDVLGERGSALLALSRHEGAMAIYKELEGIAREHDDREKLQESLGYQATIHHLAVQWREEYPLQPPVEWRNPMTDPHEPQPTYPWADDDEAMRLYREQARICLELNNRRSLATCLGNQALVSLHGGDLDEAMRLNKEVERIFRDLADRQGLQAILNNQAWILADNGKLDEALKLYQEKGGICREIGDPVGIVDSLVSQSQILKSKGRPQEALKLVDEAETFVANLDLTININLDRLRFDLTEMLKAAPRRDASSDHEAAEIPTPYPGAEGAAQLNIRYQRRLAQWDALPWWKRLTAKRPQPPMGI